MERSGGPAKYNPGAFLEAVNEAALWKEDGPPDQPLYCSHHQSDQAHPVDKIFERRELHLGSCLQHAVCRRMDRGQLLAPRALKNWERTDGRRGKTLTKSSLRENLKRANEHLWSPVSFDWSHVRAGVMKGNVREALAPLLSEVGMRFEDFDCGPVDDTVCPSTSASSLRCYRFVRRSTKFDKTTLLAMSRATRRRTASAPSLLTGSTGSRPNSSSLPLASCLGQTALIDHLASYLDRSYDLCAKSPTASQKTVSQSVISSGDARSKLSSVNSSIRASPSQT